MKEFSGKTVEECVSKAASELNLDASELRYEVKEEKSGFLGIGKKATIEVYELSDIVEYALNYITNVCKALHLEISLKPFINETSGIIKILIETDHNAILIGKNGATLQALNELTKLAVNIKFKKKFRILLDIGDYKDKKYSKVIIQAKRAAKEVLKTHVEIKLDPMTPDERKRVHNALNSWKNIKTESIGDGKDRAIIIKYVANETTPSNENEEVKETETKEE